MSTRRSILTFCLGLAASWTGCGRSPLSLGPDAGHTDQGVAPDTALLDSGALADLPPAPAVDGLPPQGDGPCSPGCVDRCKWVYGCGLFPKGPEACLAECPTWNPLIASCLDLQLCSAGGAQCDAAKQCILDPPEPNLALQALGATVKGDAATFSLEVCNTGAGKSAAFTIGLTYDSAVAPPAGSTPDQLLTVTGGLGPGQCAQLQLVRKKTPAGSYQAWAMADPANQLVESDEADNLAGPAAYTVAPPKLPDLVVKSFDATLSGSDIAYSAQVCNEGGVPAGLFRVDLYYKRIVAPTVYMVGDQNQLYLFGLKAGGCTTITRSYKNAPVGLYNSWLQVDTLNTVKEAKEGNNVAGPRLVNVTPQSGCIQLCSFATGCGLFKVTEFGQCLSWCNSLDSTERTCVEDAVPSCSALKQCTLPPPPPPPPPPWACLQICNYLSKTCNLVQGNQTPLCVGGCMTLPQTKVQCALNAMSNKQCLPMALCIF